MQRGAQTINNDKNTTKMERDYSKKVYIFSISDSMGVIVVGSGETRLKAKRDAKENLKTYFYLPT